MSSPKEEKPNLGSSSESLASKLKEIFEALTDIDLAGRIEDQEAKPLGLGSSSDIFRARWTAQNKIVAVKRIRVFLLDNISFAKNLGREVRLWSKLNHPNVLPLLGYFLEGSKPIPNLVSEWMKNGTVIEYMRDRPSDAYEMCKMVCGIASGLHYIHLEHHMIHADLKGSNILVSDDGRPLLADFGLSVSSGSTSLAATTYHGQKGSLRWMAKELHSNSSDDSDVLENPKHTTMTDMWAFGMVISELLTQKIPYESINDRRITAAILSGKLPQEPDFEGLSDSIIVRGLWGIARDCWRDNPLERPSALDVYNELLSFKRSCQDCQDNTKRNRDLVFEIEGLRDKLKEYEMILQALTQSDHRSRAESTNKNSPVYSDLPPGLLSTLSSPGVGVSSASAAAAALSIKMGAHSEGNKALFSGVSARNAPSSTAQSAPLNPNFTPGSNCGLSSVRSVPDPTAPKPPAHHQPPKNTHEEYWRARNDLESQRQGVISNGAFATLVTAEVPRGPNSSLNNSRPPAPPKPRAVERRANSDGPPLHYAASHGL